MMTKIPSRRSAGIKTSFGIFMALALVVVFACEKKSSTTMETGTDNGLAIGSTDSLLKISCDTKDVSLVDSLLRSRNYKMVSVTNKDGNVSSLIFKKSDPEPGTRPEVKIETTAELPQEEVVFFIVEEMPEFPGGEEALRAFISQNIDYPAVAQDKGIQGKVYVTFVVSADGSVKNAKVVRGVDPVLDQEALRVVNAMPRWAPGKQRGQAVNVAYTVPISFVLQ